MTIRDIYYIHSRLTKQEHDIETAISRIDYKDWAFYREYRTGQNINEPTILKELFCLKQILKLYPRNIKDITIEQLIILNFKIHDLTLSANTIFDIQSFLRRFLLLFSKTDKRTNQIKKYLRIVRKPKPKAPTRLITKEDLLILLRWMPTDDMKLMIKILYATGMRITEIFNIKPSGIIQYGPYIWINTRGKRTNYNPEGKYRYFMVFYVEELKRFARNKDQETYIFNVKYSYFLRKIKECIEKNNMDLIIHPHLFRHTRATELFKHYSPQKVNKCMNWSPNSNMQGVYCNLYDADIIDTYTDYKEHKY